MGLSIRLVPPCWGDRRRSVPKPWNTATHVSGQECVSVSQRTLQASLISCRPCNRQAKGVYRLYREKEQAVTFRKNVNCHFSAIPSPHHIGPGNRSHPPGMPSAERNLLISIQMKAASRGPRGLPSSEAQHMWILRSANWPTPRIPLKDCLWCGICRSPRSCLLNRQQSNKALSSYVPGRETLLKTLGWSKRFIT